MALLEHAEWKQQTELHSNWSSGSRTLAWRDRLINSFLLLTIFLAGDLRRDLPWDWSSDWLLLGL